jgi:hypothetical protein
MQIPCVFTEIVNTFFSDCPLTFQITLVSNNNNRHVAFVTDSINAIEDLLDFIERLLVGDGIDKDEALTFFDPMFLHDDVFFLTGRIQNL